MPGDRCHLWITSAEAIEDPELLAAYAELMAPEERRRHARLRRPRDRHRFLVTRALVRTTLSRYSAVAPKDWTFGRGRHGRPFVAGPGARSPTRFNVSHTDGMIVCLVARRRIGVDVENTARRLKARELATRFFAPEEVADLEGLTEAELPRRFFAYWTLKESYLKALGRGLSLPLDRIAFALDGGEITARWVGRAQERLGGWQFWQAALGPDHLVAASVHIGGKPRQVVESATVVPLVDDEIRPSASRSPTRSQSLGAS